MIGVIFVMENVGCVGDAPLYAKDYWCVTDAPYSLYTISSWFAMSQFFLYSYEKARGIMTYDHRNISE